MGMTMTQKILAAHAGLDFVEAGDYIEADLDVVLGNDITAPSAIREFRSMGAGRVFDQHKVVLIPDTLRRTRTSKRRSSALKCANL